MKKILIFVSIIIIGIYLFFKIFIPTPIIEQGNNIEIPQEINIELIAQGFISPLSLISSNDGTGRMFVVDQTGVIKIIDSDNNVLEDNFLDLRNKLVTLNSNYDERGLLGLAFHPYFKENGRFFVYYTAPLRTSGPAGWNCTSIVSEFIIDENNTNKANFNSEKIILQIDQPQANHNGGHIAFGPDGYLYISLGDGGQANDVGLGHSLIGNGQDVSTLLGKILRIDIDNGNLYSIPQDNPFVDKNGLDEIFAYGFRNPYHISFDKEGNRELFVADVGQNLWEEVNIVTKGNNYGWNVKEGSHCFNVENPNQSLNNCSRVDLEGQILLDPIIEYGHPNNEGFGIAIVGGHVYRGEKINGLYGSYVFADWSKGFIQGDGSIFVASKDNSTWSFKELTILNSENGRINLFIKGIGQDEKNELYVLTSESRGPNGNSGKIFKLVP